jgi:hypothetical protein
MAEKYLTELVRLTSGGWPFSIVASATSLGSSSFKLKFISRSQPVKIQRSKRNEEELTKHLDEQYL